jgi:hypothetical protein
MTPTTDVVQKLWNLCHVVRDNESYAELTLSCNLAVPVSSCRWEINISPPKTVTAQLESNQLLLRGTSLVISGTSFVVAGVDAIANFPAS